MILTDLQSRIVAAMKPGKRYFARELAEAVGWGTVTPAFRRALAEMVDEGLLRDTIMGNWGVVYTLSA